MFEPNAEKSIPSLIKWTGSKRKQAPLIAKEIPPYNRYFEPFLGGGALLYLCASENAVASDLYKPLIDLWILIQNEPEQVISDYTQKWNLLDAEYKELQAKNIKNKNGLPKIFYDCRDSFNKTHNPLDLNFIMRTCVNGIVRFNDKGEFNNSFHLSRQGMKPEQFKKNVLLWNERIQDVIFKAQDYRQTVDDAKSGDFIYFDPPYANSHNRYVADLDLASFIETLERLNSKNVNWAVSFDGSRGKSDYKTKLPKEIFKRKILLSNGNSTLNNLLNSKKEEVFESLYLNFDK